MTKQANSAAIGAFVLGAAAIATAAMIYLAGSGWGVERNKLVMVFDSSVKGLSVGAPVAFKGVQIGEVTKIGIYLDTESFEVVMPVEVSIVNGRIKTMGEGTNSTGESTVEELVARGMRAQLQLQSLLTGLLYIQLDFHPESELAYIDVPSPYVQIPTTPTDLDRLSKNLESLDFAELSEDLQGTLEGIHELVDDTELRAMPGNLNETLGALEALSEQLSAQLAVTIPKIDSLLEESEDTVKALRREIPVLSNSAQETLVQANSAINSFEDTMASIDYLASDDSVVLYQISEAAKELAKAGRSLQELARTLEEQPESILKGKAALGN